MNKPSILSRSTPEDTIRSLWALELEDRLRGLEALRRSEQFTVYSARARVEWMQTVDNLTQELSTEQRRIDKVDLPTEGHAIVLVSEPPYPFRHDKDGTQKKYLLSKGKESWEVDDVQIPCSRCEGTGLYAPQPWDDPDRDSSVHGRCPKCQGLGWDSTIFGHQEEK